MISLSKNYLTSIVDLDEKEIMNLISQAIAFKRNKDSSKYNESLTGKTLALIFEKPTTPTCCGTSIFKERRAASAPIAVSSFMAKMASGLRLIFINSSVRS